MPTSPGGSSILPPCMNLRNPAPLLALLLVLSGLQGAEAEAGKKAKAKPKPTATPTATPTPPPYLRAAGACVRYEPGQVLIVAEVGETGRAFRIDGETSIEVKPVLGARVRVFYVEGPAGPIARRVVPGPVAQPAPDR